MLPNSVKQVAARSGYPQCVDMAVAKRVDLIVLPNGVPGTNCANCKFVSQGPQGMLCKNPRVMQPVGPRMCCALWDNAGVVRPWGKQVEPSATGAKTDAVPKPTTK